MSLKQMTSLTMNILCLDVWEFRSLYIQIFGVVSLGFLETVI